MLGYTRRQLILLFVVIAGGAGGLAIDHWRRANPDVVAYLETLDRSAPPPTPPEPTPRRVAARARETPHEGGQSRPAREPRAEHGRGRHARADDATPLDLNRASATDFERLPGVGPALAARIVDVRARDGPFGSVDDLRRVRGIGHATLERLRPLLAVDTP